jgi:hypothetical protein
MCWERYIRGGTFGERYILRLSLGGFYVIQITSKLAHQNYLNEVNFLCKTLY